MFRTALALAALALTLAGAAHGEEQFSLYRGIPFEFALLLAQTLLLAQKREPPVRDWENRCSAPP
jgi:hypothetical protein